MEKASAINEVESGLNSSKQLQQSILQLQKQSRLLQDDLSRP